jgi:hypothetical protein
MSKEDTMIPENEDFFAEEPTEENTAPDVEPDESADENLADDETPAAVEGNGATDVLPLEGHTADLSGIQGDVHESPENDAPDEDSKKAVEPEFLKNPLSSDENEKQAENQPEQENITSSGNKIFEESEARPPSGQVHQANTTAAYIEIVQPRIPGLEAMLRATATDSGLADGSIKPEDAPGHKVPEGGINPESGGRAEDGNSITGATKPTEDPKVNPNSPIQVGDTKETAQAASNAKIENGDATGEQKSFSTDIDAPAKDGGIGKLGENETTLQSSASGFAPLDFTDGKPEQLTEKGE